MTDPNQPHPPAGWYPDGRGSQRWWDGSQWTEHAQPAAPTAPVPPAPQPPAGAGSNRRLVIALAGGGGALLLLIVLSVVLVKVVGGGGPEGAAKEYLLAGAEGDFATVCELTAADEQESLLDDADADDCGEFGRTRREEQRDGFQDSYDYDFDDIEDSFDYDVEDSTTDRRSMTLVEEDGEWRVENPYAG